MTDRHVAIFFWLLVDLSFVPFLSMHNQPRPYQVQLNFCCKKSREKTWIERYEASCMGELEHEPQACAWTPDRRQTKRVQEFLIIWERGNHSGLTWSYARGRNHPLSAFDPRTYSQALCTDTVQSCCVLQLPFLFDPWCTVLSFLSFTHPFHTQRSASTYWSSSLFVFCCQAFRFHNLSLQPSIAHVLCYSCLHLL